MSYSTNGYGLSGICSKSFTVAIPKKDFAGGSENAAVQLTCTNQTLLKFPKMYIANRGITDNGVVLNCNDRMIFINQTIALIDNYYYAPGDQDKDGNVETGELIEVHETSYDADGNIAIAVLLNTIAEQCGFSSWQATNSTGVNAIEKMSKEQTYKRSCGDILNSIATACCGYWFCDDTTGTERLIFKAFGSSPYLSNVLTSTNAKIVMGGTKGPLNNLIMQNGEEVYNSGGGGTMYSTIKINTPLASNNIVGYVEGQFDGYTYQAWKCDKALINSIPTFDTSIIFKTVSGNITLISNYGTVTPTSTGIYFSGGANEVSEDEYDYTGKLHRDILNRIVWGERFGRGQINPDGKYVSYIDKNDYAEV